MPGNTAYRFTSPRLAEEHQILRECPVGAILRETPYIYEAVSAQSYAEAGAFDPSTKPTWLQEAMRIVGSERSRLWDIKRERERSSRDAAYAAKVLGRE